MDKLADYGKVIVVALAITLIVFFLLDFISGKSVTSSGIVVEKHYREERVYVTIRTRTDSKGRSTTYPEINRVPPSWTIFAQCSTGEVVKVDCSPEVYYSKEKGQIFFFYNQVRRDYKNSFNEGKQILIYGTDDD